MLRVFDHEEASRRAAGGHRCLGGGGCLEKKEEEEGEGDPAESPHLGDLTCSEREPDRTERSNILLVLDLKDSVRAEIVAKTQDTTYRQTFLFSANCLKSEIHDFNHGKLLW